jgi:hypothetical protein
MTVNYVQQFKPNIDMTVNSVQQFKPIKSSKCFLFYSIIKHGNFLHTIKNVCNFEKKNISKDKIIIKSQIHCH